MLDATWIGKALQRSLDFVTICFKDTLQFVSYGCKLTNSIAKAAPKKSAPNDFLSKQQGIDKRTQNYSLIMLLQCLNSKRTKGASNQITEICREIKEYVHELEIELPGDLKKIPKKLEEFTSAGELVKNKGQEAITHEETKEKESETDCDAEAKLSGSMVESFRKKQLKKFDFVIKEGDHVHLIAKQIKEQKRIDESAKADMAKKEEELEKEELIDLVGIDLVTNVYKSKMKYDKYYDKMLNRRALERIINCDIISKVMDVISMLSFLSFKIIQFDDGILFSKRMGEVNL
uniref:Uncharacterized protein n=1 Tax=Tanacetum cinerariifolium TaxID=118510 RepID=A0A699IHZ2_TANCI|nr:hypothetical protein [Tanacetum cinerariifolium]